VHVQPRGGTSSQHDSIAFDISEMAARFGRVIAQDVSPWLLIALAGIELSSVHTGFVVDKEADFLQVLRFPQPLIPNSSPSEAGTVSQRVGDEPSGLSLTPSHPTPRTCYSNATKTRRSS
jgi:hypothetical protein